MLVGINTTDSIPKHCLHIHIAGNSHPFNEVTEQNEHTGAFPMTTFIILD